MAADPDPDTASPFRHGVASFDPTAGGVLLWAHAEGAAGGRLGWHVALEPAGPPVREGTVEVPDDAGGCVTVDVDGLDPATTYHYWFYLGGVVSPIGRTRTLPEGPTP